MKYNIKIHTSYVSKKNLDIFKKHNILPIFIIRQINDNDLISEYSDTLAHFKDLGPKPEINKIKYYNFSKFREIYLQYLNTLNLEVLIKRLEYLLKLSEAKSVVLLGYGVDRDMCHRSILANLLNSSNLLSNKVTELIL